MYSFDDIVKKVILTQKEFAIYETLKVDEDNFLSYIFFSPKGKLILTNPQNIEKFFEQLENKLNKGFYLAGFLSYELGYFLDYKDSVYYNFKFPLAFFYVFEKPIVYNHKTDIFEEGTDLIQRLFSVDLVKENSKFKLTNFKLNTSKKEYVENVKKIKNYIFSGDTYQINYTIKLKFDFTGSILGLYNKLKQTQSVSYCAFIKTKDFSVISFSPELFFRKTTDIIIVKPMKGTIPRGKDVFEDKIQVRKLQNSVKDRAENVMIVDLLRNDLGKISSYGEVKVKKLFEIEKYETLFQMTSTIQAKINPNINLYKLFYSLFPSGSVTGAPKIRSMQIIKEVEKEPRYVYTGSVGFIKPNRDSVFNVAIRTLLIGKNGKAELGIGSGIVADSYPQKEYDECKLKYKFLITKIPKFRLVETILYCADFNYEIKNFYDLNLNITKENFEQGYFLLKYHLERLKNSAMYFDFKFDEGQIFDKLYKLKKQLIKQAYRIRLLLSKNGDVEIQKSVYDIKNFCSKKIEKITISKSFVDKNNVFLYHKTTNRRVYNKEYKKYSGRFFDVLFINKNGEVTETSRANVFVKIGDYYYTPPKSSGLLNGVFKKFLIEQNKDKIKDKTISIDEVFKSEKLFITNAVFGIKEVKLFD
jgi:para-aminobenzoate synthetase/4-amino-4-deoxychorismate lyase